MYNRKLTKIKLVVSALLAVLVVTGEISPTFAAPKKSGSAASKNKKSTKKKPAEAPAPEPSELPSAKSSHKSFEFLLNAGLASPFTAFGGTAGMFIGSTKNAAIEASLLLASGKVDPIAVSQTIMTARYRRNLGNIPYLAGGLGLRSSSGKWYSLSSDGTASDDDLLTTATNNAVVVELAGGAQWRLGSFAIGADVGVLYPAFKLSSSEKAPAVAYDEADLQEQKDRFNGVNGLGIIAKLGIGFLF